MGSASVHFRFFDHPFVVPAPTSFKMSKVQGPDLKKYMDQKMRILLNGKREVTGVLRGFDQFMNLVLDDSQEIVSEKEKNDIGVVVIRGNSIIQMELLEISTL